MAYLSHHAIIVILVWMEEEEGPPMAEILNSHKPYLANWPTWLPPYLFVMAAQKRWKVKMNLYRTLNGAPKQFMMGE